ncbi:MAG: hypothetical protein A2020_08560 [Lentisphaerae bacterium GWF2_45_14]|nr:MAG: hypothetical protein A2020_08560 [Lentisphaerae bacterium GWF2_45_14]
MKFLKNIHPVWPFVLVPFIFVACLAFGDTMRNPLDIFSGDIILSLRARCLLTAFTVGAALAVSGTGYQSVLRNPLAEPYILGISGGASLGAAFAIASGLAELNHFYLLFLSFAGALIVLSAVLLIARGAGAEYSNNIMLSGIIAGTVCSSLLMFLISTLDSQKLSSVTWWMLGSLQPGDNTLLAIVICVLLLSTAALFLLGRDADIISFGEETAYCMGISPVKVIILILGISSFLTAAAVSISGIIGFVGLVVPHVLRIISGCGHRRLFPMALACGGIFLMICDTFSRSAMSPQIIPVGVITSLIGGPFFLWLLNRKRKAAL